MKSAYELAMERLGLGEARYTKEQKAQLAEIDKEYDQKTKQKQFEAGKELQEAGDDAEKAKQIKSRLASDLETLESRREKAKEKVRNG